MKAICASLILALLVTSTLALGVCPVTADDSFHIYINSVTTGTSLATGATAASGATAATGPTAVASTTGSVCHEIWNIETSGGCCETTKISTAFNLRITDIKAKWDLFIAGALVVNTTLAKLKTMANSTAITTDLAAARAVSGGAAQFEDLTDAQSVTLAKMIDNYAVGVVAFKAEAKACFDALVNYRGAAFCYGCSAKVAHQDYFSTLGVFTISQATRTAAAAVCVKPWNFIYTLGGALQVLAILNKQRSGSVAAVRPDGGPTYAGVTSANLYAAVMACPNSTVTTTCTQTHIDNIVLANFNLFMAEKYAMAGNLVATTSSSQTTRRMLADTVASGNIAIALTDSTGADLTVTLAMRPVSTLTIATTTLPDAPVVAPGSGSGSGTVASAGNIFAMTAIATLAAFVLTLN